MVENERNDISSSVILFLNVMFVNVSPAYVYINIISFEKPKILSVAALETDFVLFNSSLYIPILFSMDKLKSELHWHSVTLPFPRSRVPGSILSFGLWSFVCPIMGNANF